MAPVATLEYRSRPSVPRFMLRAFYPGALRRKGPYPPLVARWRGHRVDRRALEAFVGLTGVEAGGALPLLYPYVFGFPLQMAILTHPSCPLPIWRLLQIRSALRLHRPVPADAVLDLETAVGAQRVLEKGLEVDLHVRVAAEGAPAWEGVTTYYARGRFGFARAAGASPPAGGAGRVEAASPPFGDALVARWRAAAGAGWRVGGLTGDFNPLHWSSAYARRRGYRRAFLHPQIVLGQALARLGAAAPAPGQRLDAWIKGPVYDGIDVALRAAAGPGATTFGVVPDGEQRAAIVGRLGAAPA